MWLSRAIRNLQVMVPLCLKNFLNNSWKTSSCAKNKWKKYGSLKEIREQIWIIVDMIFLNSVFLNVLKIQIIIFCVKKYSKKYCITKKKKQNKKKKRNKSKE